MQVWSFQTVQIALSTCTIQHNKILKIPTQTETTFNEVIAVTN